MAAVVLFGTFQVCSYMLYLIYAAIFLVSLVILAHYASDDRKGIRRRRMKLIARKQREREQQFAEIRERFSSSAVAAKVGEFQRIISLQLDPLLTELRCKTVSACDVLDAYVYKATSVSETLNCVSEFNLKAWEIAQNLDERNDDVLRPLHGLPVCIKEDTDIEGMDTTLGCSRDLFKPAESNAAIVTALRSLGAVPFCKTNLPQTTLSNGSDNPIFGHTKNCIRPDLSPAGSSSGTASLIGGNGAMVGIGTDLGGSVRTPAHNCGISSIRPTIGRLSAKGIKTALPTVGLTIVPGVMARDSNTVAEVFRCLVDNQLQHKLDPTCPPLSWDKRLFGCQEKLKIGYFTSLPFFPTVGDTPSTVIKACKALQLRGHETVEFEMPNSSEISELFLKICLADSGESLRKMLESEPIISADLKETWPDILGAGWRQTFKNLLRFEITDEQANTHLWYAWKRRNEIRDEVMEKMRSSNISALITPVFAFPAVSPEDTRKLLSASYTMMWSLLDFPVAVTRFDYESGNDLSISKSDGSLVKLGKLAAKASVGMPIGVQVVARPFEEELCLRLACELDELRSNNSEHI